MKTVDQFSSPPTDYNVAVPDGWFQLGHVKIARRRLPRD